MPTALVACAISGVVPDVAAAQGHYATMLGSQAIVPRKAGFDLRLNDRQSIGLMTADAAQDLWPTFALPPVGETGYLHSVTLQVADVAATKTFFDANRIACHFTDGGALRISPAKSCGVSLEFTDDIPVGVPPNWPRPTWLLIGALT